jgi:hypothetical protein
MISHLHDKRTEWYILSFVIAGLHKKPTFFIPAVCASLTKVTAHLPQSRDRSCYFSRPILKPPQPRLQKHTRTTSRTLPVCNISLGSQKLPEPQVGNFVGLILIYTQIATLRWAVQGIELWPSRNLLKRVSHPSAILCLRLPVLMVCLVTWAVQMGSVTRT